MTDTTERDTVTTEKIAREQDIESAIARLVKLHVENDLIIAVLAAVQDPAERANLAAALCPPVRSEKTGIAPRDTDGEAPRNSGTVLDELKVIARRYEDLVASEVADLDDDALAQLANNRSSIWSGGCSIDNYADQVQRRTALERLSDNLRVAALTA